MGFAIERTDHDVVPVEKHPLWSFKTFKSVVPVPVASQKYSTFDHPIQSFYWGDYSATPGHRYTYRVVPRFGHPKNLHAKTNVEVAIDVTTADPDGGVHGVFFNRGTSASQAYVQKFGKPPDKLPPDERLNALAWLSRGLEEAMLAVIKQADSSQWALRAAVYEFTEPPVLRAFKAAHDAGADVKVIYHAVDDDTGGPNATAIADAQLPAEMLIPRLHTKTIAHNKFIVLGRTTAAPQVDPVLVWTGSTNLSEGGIFGHSNVGHEVRDPAIAHQYLDYWDSVSSDPTTDALKVWVDAHNPFDPAKFTDDGAYVVFSPRRGTSPLRWYADRFASAPVVSNITFPFGMSNEFEQPLETSTVDELRYVLLDKHDNNQETWAAPHNVLVAVGKLASPDSLTRWAKEGLTGYNKRVLYLHTKILLVDPISDRPTVISGSANFSVASTSSNDENMLVIVGDTDLADVYLTEYARIFYNFYARYWAAQLNTQDDDSSTHSFLEETAQWMGPYFASGGSKARVRELFTTQVQANI